jgi:galactokinase
MPNKGRQVLSPDELAGRLANRFSRTYGQPADVAWLAPGRVNLIGEHTDYNGGLVLPFAIARSVAVAAASRDDGILEMRSTQVGGEPVTVSLAGLEPGSVSGWAAYPAGVAWALGLSADVSAGTAGRGGASLLVDADLPQGAGLASSAALECAVAGCLADLAGLEMSGRELAARARRAENDFVGLPSGIMDQSASMLCEAGHALLLDCSTGESRSVPLDPAELRFLVIDTGVRHELTGSEYAERHAQCEAAARELGVRVLSEASDLTALSDPVLVRRARHVLTENDRVRQAAALLQRGRLADCGPLLTASHESLRGDFEVSWSEADLSVEAALAAGALGARMTGGGFGGCVLALVPDEEQTEVTAAVSAAFADSGRSAPAFLDVMPAAGAHKIWQRAGCDLDQAERG